MASARPYYEFRDIAHGLAKINRVGQRTLEMKATGVDGQIADDLLRLDHLSTRLAAAIGELENGRPDDPETIWQLLPDIERELCRWTYEPPLYIVPSGMGDGESGYGEPTLNEAYRPRTLLDQLQAARVELAALEPQSLVLSLERPAVPQLSSLDAPGL